MNTLDLAKQLIARPSITPDDAGCQTLITDFLKELGFEIQQLPADNVSNIWATLGHSKPLFVFAGHTDVVPPGPESQWESPPFTPTEKNGYLYGRGAADMKGGLAAMLIACKEFISSNPNFNGTIGFLITSDEEGDAINGTRKVIDYLNQKNIQIDYCLIGEATSNKKAGDTIKVGRRGSLTGRLKILGKQGHIAYPQYADNPIHKSFLALSTLYQTTWDQGNQDFPPTSFQISNLHAGTGAGNVIPGETNVVFNFRYSTEVTSKILQEKVHSLLDQHQLNYQLDWHESGNPFHTRDGQLLEAVQKSIDDITGLKTELSTSGGTSDGRFIAPTGAQVIECGPCNATIHQINEHVSINDLETLTKIYQRLLERLLTIT